jgi:hypothetical protein
MMGQQQTVSGNALRRMIMSLTVAVVMAAIMVAMAAPAFADNLKLNKGEPLLSGGRNNVTIHCGPVFDGLTGTETNTHGAFHTNNDGGNCVQAPQH